MGQVAFELARQVQQGTSRFTIRLDPPELGRVDVKLQVDAGGGVSARLSVDRAETLDLFQRDQRTLERALAQAGLDPARTSLEFSLRQNPGQSGGQPQQHQQQHDWFSADGGGRAEPAADAPAPVLTLYRGTAGPAGVNLFV
jgi:flagellar hook-length control protein FliK